MANITYIKIGNEVYRLHDGNALTSESNLDASKVVGTLPANTYIDTTYENKAAVEGGTDVSLVTTGDKYRWNQGGSGSDEIFVVEYGVTTYAEVLAAIEDEQKIIIKRKESGEESPDVLYYVNRYIIANDNIYLNAIGYDSYISVYIFLDGQWSLGESRFKMEGGYLTKSVIDYNVTSFGDIQTKLQSIYADTDIIPFINDPSYGLGLILSYSNSSTSSQEKIEFTALLDSLSNTLPYKIKYTVIQKLNTGVVTWSRSSTQLQSKLVSGTSIKTINNTSLLGSGDISVLDADSTLSAAKLTGAIPSAVTATTQSSGDNSTKIATTAYVDGAINDLPEPMVFQGSLGEGGTISILPSASSLNKGYTYKVITDGTYASQAAKVGDTFISDGTTWILIPSGDEPSGTVTSIATGVGLTGGPVTSSGTIKVNLVSETSQGTIGVTDKLYAVGVDSTGALCALVPWTDTTYESKTAASGGTDVSLVTTGEKFSWNNKQESLVSGTNIKTINNQSILGSGDITVSTVAAQIVRW